MREALAGSDTAFVLMPVVPDELTRALVTLSLAAEAKVKRVVYFSMVNADTFSDCPHAAAKYAAEQSIRRLGLAATILRPNYFLCFHKMCSRPAARLTATRSSPGSGTSPR
jgi:uncharacterized protein YbjT (DUF2867 family)